MLEAYWKVPTPNKNNSRKTKVFMAKAPRSERPRLIQPWRPNPERGGKAKRYFRITSEGLHQAQETRRVLRTQAVRANESATLALIRALTTRGLFVSDRVT